MYHSKSCRCDLCQAIPTTRKPKECSHNWKNRFCKLRKQWSEHSKCGSQNHNPEDCTDCRSPCNQAVSKFGIAWVAEIPGCETQEPRGWQVEIVDTPQGILRKSRLLIKWLNNPPPHLYDSIEGNDMPCDLCMPKCSLNTSCVPNCENLWSKKNKCYDNCEQSDDECMNPCVEQCSDYATCVNECSLGKCGGNCCSIPKKNCENQPKKFKPCFAACRTSDESSCDECTNRRPSSRKKKCCRISSSPMLEDIGETFRKENCCCRCHEKFFKNAATSCDIDTIPQRDDHHFIHLDDVESDAVCIGIRSSKICRKLKEERRHQILEKDERELNNTVIANGVTEHPENDGTTNLYVNKKSFESQNTLNNVVNENGVKQRRSSKFRRKESLG